MNGDQPAFPCPVGHIECHHPVGMTYRQWLAGMALQGLLANGAFDEGYKWLLDGGIDMIRSSQTAAKGVSILALALTDALIAAENVKGEGK